MSRLAQVSDAKKQSKPGNYLEEEQWFKAI